MAVSILESLVQRVVSVVRNVGTELRIGSKSAAGEPSALFLPYSTPSYPAAGNKPNGRPWHEPQGTACAAGRPGSSGSVPASRCLPMGVLGQGLMRKSARTGASAMDHVSGHGHRPAAITAIADAARAAAQFEPTATGAFTASARGERFAAV